MVYTPTVWKDRDVQNPRTYSVRENEDGTVTLFDAPGEIYEQGTPVNAANLNKIEEELTKKGGGLEIGDIGFAAFGINETLNERRYLNGQVISQSQFEAFTKMIKERAALYPSLVTSETNWQAEVTNSKLGQCGKFVIDDELGTIRLPKVVNVQGLADLTLMGSIKAESLPNIMINTSLQYQSMQSDLAWNNSVSGTGTSFSGTTSSDGVQQINVGAKYPTYQDNAPVQQEAIQYPYFIQVATGVEESVDVTREIELNNPFSLLDYKWSEYEISNASWLISNGAFHSGATYKAVYELLLKIHNGTETKDGVSVKLSTEEYTDTDFVINTADTTFRLPVKVALASSNKVAGNGMDLGLNISNDGETGLQKLGHFFANNASGGRATGINAGFDKNINIGNQFGITTDPEKSGIETSSSGLKLYFYVGETIQDANVIAASQVLTTVADSVRKSSAADRATVVGWGMPDYTAGIQVKNSNTGQGTYTTEFDCVFVVRFLSAGYCHWRLSDGDAEMLCGTNGNNYTQIPVYVRKGVTLTGIGAGGTWNVFVFPLIGEV
ncbi:MAG: hypothetical protein IJW72_00420 [Alphaproteobacteria bacterium]|nr:hypothetical protein [Alphaproteobacteria bacterium]MBQ7284706.1 hypothetical protein [Alphaproteobacteria bacterium]